MASDQQCLFVVPAGDLARVTSAVRDAYPTALIGTKPHETDSVLLAVTLYSEQPEGLEQLLSALGADTLKAGAPPPAKSLSDLVDEVKRLRS